MTFRNSVSVAVAAFALVAMTGSANAQDPAAGEKAFAKCKACHAVGAGAANKIGPQLNGVVGRKIASVEGYQYSPAMMKMAEKGAWTPELLEQYLADPKKVVPGTKMVFPGIKKPDELKNLIAYLQTQK